MKTLKPLFSLFVIMMCLCAHAQVKTNFNNDKAIAGRGHFSKNYTTQTDLELPAKNINALLAKEKRLQEQSSQTKPFQLAEPVAIDLDISRNIKWMLDGDSAFGKYTIHLKGALSASINFDKFYLPKGTEMYIYNQGGKMITGAITEKENNAKKTWGSWVLQGPVLTVEIKTPAKTVNELQLHSKNIAYGYKEVYAKTGGFGSAGACEINVLCPLGNGWADERNSVALVLNDNGSVWCSGAMVMNACNTNRPFFLTAEHCFNPPGYPQQDETLWRFTFQAWSSTCTPDQNSNGTTYNGSTMRANWASSDFALVELNSPPPANSGIFYAGWSRSTTAATSGTGIHHPSGDVMKISQDNNTLSLGTFSGLPTNYHWRSDWSAHTNNGSTVTPVTEGGSSGSPLFDQNHRIVGQLSGGPSYCGGPNLWDFYGRFDLSWTGNGTNSTRLSNWLDPGSTGATTSNTTWISSMTPTISGDAVVCSTSNPYTVNNAPSGASYSWTATPSGVVLINNSTSSSTTITKLTDGEVQLSVTVTACGYAMTATLPGIKVGVPAPVTSITVNNVDPSSGYVCHYYESMLVALPPVIETGVTYEWSLPSDWTTLQTGTPYASSADYIMPVYPGTDGYVYVRRLNSCGYSSNFSVNVSFDPYCSFFMISPNPAKNNISIDGQKSKKNIKEVRIIDKTGQVKKTVRYSTNIQRVNLDISGLVPDVYYIKIFDGKTWSTKPLMVH
jgi:lysyl endopeptidase